MQGLHPSGADQRGGGTGAAIPVLVDARKSVRLAGAPQPGSVSPYLLLGKKSNTIEI